MHPTTFPPNILDRMGPDAISVGHAILDMAHGGAREERARLRLPERLREYGIPVTEHSLDAAARHLTEVLDASLPGWREPRTARKANKDGRHPIPGRRQRPRRAPMPEPGFDMRGLMTRLNRIRANHGEPTVHEGDWPRTKLEGAPYEAEVALRTRRRTPTPKRLIKRIDS